MLGSRRSQRVAKIDLPCSPGDHLMPLRGQQGCEGQDVSEGWASVALHEGRGARALRVAGVPFCGSREAECAELGPRLLRM